MPGPPWLDENGRFKEYVGPDDWMHVPPGPAENVVRLLTELDDYRHGSVAPGAVKQALPVEDTLLRRLRGTAADCAGRQHPRPQVPRPAVLEPAQVAASSPLAEITVAEAAGLLHVNEERVRQLLRPDGKGRPDSECLLRGRKIGQVMWMVDRASAYDEARRRSGHGTRSSTDAA